MGLMDKAWHKYRRCFCVLNSQVMRTQDTSVCCFYNCLAITKKKR